MSLLILSVVLFLAGATDADTIPADPGAAAKPDQVKSAEQKSEASRVVCRREMVVGSHRPKKLCLTKAQWKEWEDQNKDKLNNQTLQDPTPDVLKTN